MAIIITVVVTAYEDDDVGMDVHHVEILVVVIDAGNEDGEQNDEDEEAQDVGVAAQNDQDGLDDGGFGRGEGDVVGDEDGHGWLEFGVGDELGGGDVGMDDDENDDDEDADQDGNFAAPAPPPSPTQERQSEQDDVGGQDGSNCCLINTQDDSEENSEEEDIGCWGWCKRRSGSCGRCKTKCGWMQRIRKRLRAMKKW